jgi:hypothetical protein
MKTAVLLTAAFIALHTENVVLSLVLALSLICAIVLNNKFENK